MSRTRPPLQIGTAHAHFEDVRLPFGLMVARVRLDGTQINVNTKHLGADLEAPAKFSAVVTAEAIAAFLETKAPAGLKSFQVRLADGHIEVEGVLKVILEIKASATCRLVIVEGRQLRVELVSADVLSVGAKSLIQNQIDSINPLFDVAELPFDAVLEELVIAEGELTLSGTIPSGEI